MRAGELRHRITIQEAISAQDKAGQPIEAWQDVVTVWAKIEDLNGREYLAAKQVPANEVTTRITIRWRDGIKPTMRIITEQRIFDIQSIIDPDGRKQQLELMCKEVI
ncbi:phage head closure protein [Mahella australiensis]|uniref:Phage head-tail adaptor n=1 Tax=Mahella australiensis (strain DSM 15567 / CIP 107919 / 50-1 BON) TaxID=697281 RepID=F4A0G9_MAHA5|nr:phage head closure protein [Mahella australiensis]AEE98030.1 phage head-tail adaptor [Mahella australiensis 50-1 BON]